LFSAHGLPKQVIERGDPYQAQIELTAAAVASATGIADLDWSICYQSRVGPMEWIGPSTEAELHRAATDKVPVVVVPVAFVSEHSETLVELDIEYHRGPGSSGPSSHSWRSLQKIGAELSMLSGNAYLWVKAVHVIAVISWMAGLLYLPRLFVYHCTVQAGSEASETFKIMERRLLKAIMTPAMILSWTLGLLMAVEGGLFTQPWFHAKLLGVVVMTASHLFLARCKTQFAVDSNPHTEKFYRVLNEGPTLLMIFIVILVIVKPF
jgi:putative membrane protein